MPPVLVGREDVIADFAEGIENGAGAPGRLMLISGQRGFGKTVLLTELARVAESYGWTSVRETASSGLCERIISSLNASPAATVELAPTVEVAGLGSARLGSVSLETPSSRSIREAVARRFRSMAAGTGVLITIDEAQAADRNELVAVATAVQHIVADQDLRNVPDEDKHGIALVVAGLPSLIDDLTNDDVLTFLRRAMREELGPVFLPDIRSAFQQSCLETGMELGKEEALAAARISQGHPYLMQLVGYYMWQSARRRHVQTVGPEDVERAEEDARLAFCDAVCAPTYKSLSRAQRAFVEAMAPDWPGPASTLDVAVRAGKSKPWAYKYRESLIRSGVIVSYGQGELEFAIPFFGEYLQERAGGVW